MKVNVLCPGPSLAFAKPGAADQVYAVNRAALAWDCDLWVALDIQPVQWWGRLLMGAPTLLSSNNTLCVARRENYWDGPTLEIESLDRSLGQYPAELFRIYSAPTAVMWAFSRGADEIYVYGCDLRGTTDFTGQSSEGRDEQRWINEAHLWEKLVHWLKERNCRVVFK